MRVILAFIALFCLPLFASATDQVITTGLGTQAIVMPSVVSANFLTIPQETVVVQRQGLFLSNGLTVQSSFVPAGLAFGSNVIIVNNRRGFLFGRGFFGRRLFR